MHFWANLLRSAISFETQSVPTYDQAWFLLGLNVFTKIKAAEVGSCFCSMPGSSDFIKRAVKVGIDNKPPMQLVVEVIKLHRLARFCEFLKNKRWLSVEIKAASDVISISFYWYGLITHRAVSVVLLRIIRYGSNIKKISLYGQLFLDLPRSSALSE